MAVLDTGALRHVDPRVAVPQYDRERVTAGVVHIGPGAFHRAHQAAYLDSYLATGDLSWGICTVGLLPEDAAVRDAFHEQDGLYSLTTVSPDGSEEVRVIGSIVEHLHAPDCPDKVLEALTRATTRVVSLTITEGGYGVDDATGRFEPPDMRTRVDLTSSGPPRSAFGFLTSALATRRSAGTPPFSVMSCDNLTGNGQVAKTALVRFAALRDEELSGWIEDNVAFPSSMVDRITPRPDDDTRAGARRYGLDDRWPIRAESFTQWVAEDHFSDGRPDLDRVGVQWVTDVVPYEKLKLRLLNASHQVMSYLGLLSGYEHVHDVCRVPLFVDFLEGYMREEAVPTLPPVPGIDVGAYCDQLLARFAGVAVQDTLARQVVNGSDRIAKFLVPVLAGLLGQGRRTRRCALTLAAWTLFLEGRTSVAPVDHRLEELREALRADRSEPGRFLRYAPVFGDLGADPGLRADFVRAREVLGGRGGARAAIAWAAGDS